jgi:hypothetical protein
VGSTQASAATAIAAAGFVTGNVSFAYSASVALGLVVSQSPAAGTTQTFGTLINFVVSLGPQPSGPPAPTPGIFPANISGLTFSGARRKGWGTQLQESLTTKFTSIGLQKFPIVYWELSYELVRDDISPSELRSLLGLTNAQQGRAGRFLYADPLFNTVALEPFGTGNGTTTAFQLVATFQNPGGPGRPEIIQNLNGTPQIFDHGSLVSSGAYSIGVTGIVTFTTPPTNGHALTWSGSFYYRCKFVADTQDFEMLMKQWWTAKSIKFRSVIL